MADSLDDFFAKKDKKRKDKSKTSAISAVTLVKELEEGAKQAEFQVRKDAKTSTALEILGLDANDADWKDFEEVEKRDYTGLKVKEMSIQDQDEDKRRQIDRAEQLPESVPWKSKEGTVAAITSTTSADVTIPSEQQILGQLDEKPNTNDEKNESDGDKQTEEKKVEVVLEGKEKSEEKDEEKPIPKPEDADTGTNAADDSTKSVGDTKKVETTSAKKVYVPPHERGEARTLEPVRMRQLIRPGSGANIGARIGNLQDENEYPSLG